MLRRTKPAKVAVEVKTQVVATSKDKQRDKRREMNGFVAVVMVDNEAVDYATHGASHAKWAEEQCPKHFVDEIFSARENEDAGGKEDNFGYHGVQPEEQEWPDICRSAV